MKSGAGSEIRRSTSQKDRQSKVFTANGRRDRRVRLSPLTAVRFYDLQDRLGYDRPTKAVDWLINKAKFAIDELQIPDRTTAETDYSVFNSQLKLQSLAGNFAPATSATASVDFRRFPVGLIRRPAVPVRDLSLSLHNVHDTIPAEEDGSSLPARNKRLIADSIPAGYGGGDVGLWLQKPLLGENPAAAFSERRVGGARPPV